VDVLIACWSAKGGSGTSVIAAALALLLARSPEAPHGVVLADVAGDLPAVLGLPHPTAGLGLADWLEAAAGVPKDALGRLEQPVGAGLVLLPWCGKGPGATAPRAGDRNGAGALASALAADDRPVVVDCGSCVCDTGMAIADAADVSLLVLRPCYLALRRALASAPRPSGVVLVAEPGRALGRRDVEDVLGSKVMAEAPWMPEVARAVDAGLLSSRLPRGLAKALGPLTVDLLSRVPERQA